MTIYNTGDVKNGLPRYASGIWMQLATGAYYISIVEYKLTVRVLNDTVVNDISNMDIYEPIDINKGDDQNVK